MCIYSISKDQLLYDVELTHPVSTLDVWNDYILVGSFPVQLFEKKADRLRRIVVIDSEDDTYPTEVKMVFYPQSFTYTYSITFAHVYRRVTLQTWVFSCPVVVLQLLIQLAMW